MADTKTSQIPRYTVIIQWDEESSCYVVSLPEWGSYCKAYGATYEEAARNAQEVLELLMQDEPHVPKPRLFHYPGADVADLPDDSPVSAQPPVPTKKTA